MKGHSLLALNVRGLYSKLDQLYIRFHEFDISCFSETWTNASHTDEMLSLNGYELFRLDRGPYMNKQGPKTKRGGGLIIYVKKEMSKFISLYEMGCKTSTDLEQLFILYDKPNVRKCAIGIVYRPPSGKVSEGINLLSDTVRSLQLEF